MHYISQDQTWKFVSTDKHCWSVGEGGGRVNNVSLLCEIAKEKRQRKC